MITGGGLSGFLIFLVWPGFRRIVYRRRREVDVDVLWPEYKKRAHWDIQAARDAFTVHAMKEKAWLYLGREELVRRIGELH